MTPLHYAAKKGHYEVVKYLMEQKADTNSKDEFEVCFFCDKRHNTCTLYAYE